MTAPVFILRDGRRTFLKWHRARRTLGDAAFTGRRIVEGMQAGASVEVDLVVHADDGFAVLHNLTLDDVTTGRGAVRQTPAGVLRELHLCDNAGNALPDRVMLLEDLAQLLRREGVHPEGLLQLDYKEDATVLTPRALATFAAALDGIAGHFILSSGDAAAVRLLAERTPGVGIGYDPCHFGALERLRQSHDLAGFVAGAAATFPDAGMIYLDHQMVLWAADRGFDMIAAFHDRGQRVDAYTIRRADAAGLAAARRLIAMGADQITTDDPEALFHALA